MRRRVETDINNHRILQLINDGARKHVGAQHVPGQLVTCTHTHTHTHARTRAYARTHARTQTRVHAHACTPAQAHTLANTLAHTHTHTHTQWWLNDNLLIYSPLFPYLRFRTLGKSLNGKFSFSYNLVHWENPSMKIPFPNNFCTSGNSRLIMASVGRLCIYPPTHFAQNPLLNHYG